MSVYFQEVLEKMKKMMLYGENGRRGKFLNVSDKEEK